MTPASETASRRSSLTSRCSSLIPVLSVFLLALSACSSPTPQQQLATAEAAAQEAAHDGGKVVQAVALLEAVVAGHAETPEAPRALKALAMLRQQHGEMEGAISTYDRLLASYPASDEAVEAQFMTAFIYEEHLADFAAARQAYQKVIDNYPGTELAANAQILLPNVGRAPEEYVNFQDDPPTH
jgi:outer membrane protein assembly factor BamD (BamD/ComL family)